MKRVHTDYIRQIFEKLDNISKLLDHFFSTLSAFTLNEHKDKMTIEDRQSQACHWLRHEEEQPWKQEALALRWQRVHPIFACLCVQGHMQVRRKASPRHFRWLQAACCTSTSWLHGTKLRDHTRTAQQTQHGCKWSWHLDRQDDAVMSFVYINMNGPIVTTAAQWFWSSWVGPSAKIRKKERTWRRL